MTSTALEAADVDPWFSPGSSSSGSRGGPPSSSATTPARSMSRASAQLSLGSLAGLDIAGATADSAEATTDASTAARSLRRRVRTHPPTPSEDQHPLLSRSPDEDDADGRPRAGPSSAGAMLDVHDVSRPRLREARERAERLADSASEGSRPSMDTLRMTQPEEHVVEVIVHESAAGIALLYGIDLATLRKTNKLWPSDPIHLRTHLYVPLEACRFHGETLIRGPGEGQVSVVPKSLSAKALGKRAEQVSAAGHVAELIDDTARLDFGPLQDAHATHSRGVSVSSSTMRTLPNGNARGLPRSQSERLDRLTGRANGNAEPAVADDTVSGDVGNVDEDGVRVLNVVRMPTSHLRFFPPSRRAPSSRGVSLDADLLRLRRASSDSQSGPAIANDLTTLPPPLQAKKVAAPPRSNVVRLRPPTSLAASGATVAGSDIASRMTRFFDVAPPPIPHLPAPMPAKGGGSAPPPSMTRKTTAGGNARKAYGVLEGHGEWEMEVRSESSRGKAD